MQHRSEPAGRRRGRRAWPISKRGTQLKRAFACSHRSWQERLSTSWGRPGSAGRRRCRRSSRWAASRPNTTGENPVAKPRRAVLITRRLLFVLATVCWWPVRRSRGTVGVADDGRVVERINPSGNLSFFGKWMGKVSGRVEWPNEGVFSADADRGCCRDQRWTRLSQAKGVAWVVVVLEFRQAEGRLKHVEELRCSSVNDSWDTICCGRVAKHQTGRRNLGGGIGSWWSRCPKKESTKTRKEKIYQ